MIVDTADLIDVQGLAEVTGLAPNTVRDWHQRRDRPQPLLVFGTCRIWHRPTVEQWMAETRASGAMHGATLRPRPGARR